MRRSASAARLERAVCSFSAFVFLFGLGSNALSQQGTPPVGVGRGALPAVHRVGLPLELRSITVGALAGYGYTEPLVDGDGSHHRVLGSLALGVPVLEWLQLAGRVDGRFDQHEEGPDGSDTSAVGEPRIGARAIHPLSSDLSIGAEAFVWLPGADAPSVEPAAITPEFRALLGVTPAPRVRLGALVGYRLDRSGESVDQPDRLSLGDRASLGVSDSHAVLTGLGAAFGLGSGEVLSEVTFEPLVGSEAPSLSESPLLVSAGYRHFVMDALQFGGVVEALVASHPDVSPGAPLAPVEPRVAASLFLAYQFGAEKERPPSEPSKPETRDPAEGSEEPAQPAAKPEAVPVTARVVVTSPDGSVVEDAVVLLEREEARETLVFRDGAYEVDAPEQGKAVLVVVADGFEDVERPVTIESGEPFRAKVKLENALPHGQIRGLVRSFSGKPIVAKVRVEPAGRTQGEPKELSTDESGMFSVDVAPGQYLVEIGADGYRVQKRRVDVKKKGVVILNADLHEGR